MGVQLPARPASGNVMDGNAATEGRGGCPWQVQPSRTGLVALIAGFFCFICVPATQAAPGETNNAFDDLKAFLNTDTREYEVVFSAVHHSTEGMKQLVGDLQKRMPGLRVSFDEAEFFRVRRAKDGFCIQQATDLAGINSRKVSSDRGSAEGVFSNAYWLLTERLITTDQGKLVEMNKRLGTNWWEVRADESAAKALSFGLRLRRGSLKWYGTNFTAELAVGGRVQVSESRAQRISGSLSLSNGLPFAITYELYSNKFTVFLAYRTEVRCPFRIPDELRICEPLPEGRGSNIFTVQIVSLELTNLQDSRTDPSEFLKANPGVTVVEKVVDGSAKVVSLWGRPGNGAAVGMSGMDASTPRRWTRRILLGALLLPTLAFSYLLFHRRVGERGGL